MICIGNPDRNKTGFGIRVLKEKARLGVEFEKNK